MMKKFFVLITAVALLFNGCATLMDGKFVTKDGKKSPFMPHRNTFNPPVDPILEP
jgi:PBP1b-binding outer membrane lipoprotein LpoB